MARIEPITVEGVVKEVLPDQHFRIVLENGHLVLAYAAGAMKRFYKTAIAMPRPDGVILELVVPEDDLSSLGNWRGSRRTRALTVIALAGEERRAAILQAGATFCRFPCSPAELVAVVQQVLPLPA